MRFVGKVVLVTGGSSGIGRATAIAFAREGARVVVGYRSVEGGEATVRTIKDHGGDAVFVPCDVTRGPAIESLVATAIKTYGRLDVAFNNAGISGPMASIADYPSADWDSVIATNLTGVWLSMKYELAVMLPQGSGSIVNMAGAFGLIGFPKLSAYVAAKHGVIGLTKTAALECAKSGVRVNAVCPGVTRTPMVEAVTGGDAAAETAFASLMPMGRIATPEEIAAAVLWLSSDDASFVTGHPLAVDGGWVAQ